jgi:hypothetical protein
MNKRITAIGLTAGLLAGAGAGLILEMSGSAGAASNAAVVTVAPDDSAPADSSSNPTGGTDAFTDDHTARLQEVLQPLVTDGSLTQAQLDKVIAALESAGPIGGPAGDHGGPAGGRGGDHGGMGKGGGLDTVGGVLGMTADEVRTAISNGQTIAQLAEAKGSSGQAVIDALVAEVTAHFDEEVASGEHTQADADARIAEVTTRITDMVNNTQPGGPGGPGHGHGPGGAHGDMNGDGAGSGAPGTGGAIDGGPADTSTSAGA